jgi:Calcineurin-like phosphoesterase
MLREVVDRDELQRYASAVGEAIGRPELGDAAARAASTFQGAGDPVQKLRDALPAIDDEHASSGGKGSAAVPYVSRAPIQSLLQSTLESKLREQGVTDNTPPHRDLLARIAHTVESVLDPQRFGPDDAGWVTDIGRAVLERLAQGNCPFNTQPAEHEISDNARVVIVGDWGSGLPRAQAVSSFMAEEVAEALAQGRQAHVIHLGDVYYSGLPEEVTANVLAPAMWPVTNAQALAGVTSWALNGNHDMYGGGYGFFQTLLSDQRFSNQHSPDGLGTSFFRIRSPSWDLVGLDTSWDSDVVSEGQLAALEDPQAEFVADVAGESDRRLMLLSHHQLFSAYDTRPGLGQVLREKLGPVLSANRVTAWTWGHEHRCMGFQATDGVSFSRLIGNGGVPVLMTHAVEDPVPAPGAWEERGFVEDRGDRWARFGFSVFDFSGPRIEVRYRDDHGLTTRTETIS